ncbi:MAG: hypothetical protein ACTHNU_05520 [Gaiellales bacterium]
MIRPVAIRRLRNLVVAAAAAALVALSVAQPAGAAGMLARGAKWESIKVNKIGVALVSYYAHGHTYHTLVWGARNARQPSRTARQVRFHINYSGGYGSFLGMGYWKTVRKHNVCGRYRGPRLWRMVTACTMPDGSNWALQSWQADLADNGWRPSAVNMAPQLFVSHWSGSLPKLWFKADWTYAGAKGGPFDDIYGHFTYLGQPVYGYSSTRRGAPTDGYGRLVALDTYRPPWSGGYRQPDTWWRQNSFLTHRPMGDFCAGVFRRIAGVRTRTRPGRGRAYRIIANGPGVTPVVEWQDSPPGHYQPGLARLFPTVRLRGPYSSRLDSLLNRDQLQLDRGTSSCSIMH